MKTIGLHRNGTRDGVTTVSDETVLATSALAGNEEALGALLTKHQQAAYNVAYRLLGSEPDAADAFQEACLLTVKAIRGNGAPPRELERFRPWLMRVVTNVALERLRRRPRLPHVSVDQVAAHLVDSEGSDPANRLDRREDQRKVLNALLLLPDRQRAALTLREYQSLTYEEIAATLGVSRSAVETLLFRARRSFRDAYAGVAAARRPIGCADLAPLLSAMVDGELDGRAWSTISTHLARCRPCQQELHEFQRGRKLHALIPLLAPPATWAGTGPGGIALTAAAGAGTSTPAALLWTVPAKLAGLLVVKQGSAVLAMAVGAMVMASALANEDPASEVRGARVRVALPASVEPSTNDPGDQDGPSPEESQGGYGAGSILVVDHTNVVPNEAPAAFVPASDTPGTAPSDGAEQPSAARQAESSTDPAEEPRVAPSVSPEIVALRVAATPTPPVPPIAREGRAVPEPQLEPLQHQQGTGPVSTATVAKPVSTPSGVIALQQPALPVIELALTTVPVDTAALLPDALDPQGLPLPDSPPVVEETLAVGEKSGLPAAVSATAQAAVQAVPSLIPAEPEARAARLEAEELGVTESANVVAAQIKATPRSTPASGSTAGATTANANGANPSSSAAQNATTGQPVPPRATEVARAAATAIPTVRAPQPPQAATTRLPTPPSLPNTARNAATAVPKPPLPALPKP